MKTTASLFAAALFQIMLAVLAGLVFHEALSLLGAMPFAMAAVTGSLTGPGRETDGPEEHRVPSVSDVITRLAPSAFPFTTFLDRLSRTAPADQEIHRWPEISRYPREDTFSSASAAGSADSTQDVSVTHPEYWRVNDIFVVPDVAASGLGQKYLVTGKTSDATPELTVVALTEADGNTPYTSDSFGTVPAFGSGDSLLWIGNSKTESDIASAARQMQPEYKFNFVQTEDATVEISDHKMRSENFGTEDWLRQRRENLYEFRKSWEYSACFNPYPSVTTDPNNDEQRMTMGGLPFFVSETISLSGALTDKVLIGAAYAAFTDNNGSPRKILQGGAELMEAIDKAGADSNALHVNRGEKVAGVEIMSIESRVGRLDTVYHPGYDEVGKGKEGDVLDFEHIIKREYQPTERRKADLKKSGQLKDAEAEYYIGKWTLEMRNSDAHKKVVWSA